MRPLAVVVALAIVALGLIGVAAPDTLLDISRHLVTRPGLYAVAAFRVAYGALLIAIARGSRMPRTVRVVGIIVVIAGLLTPLFGVDRAHAYIGWLASQGPAIVRLVGCAAAAFGLLLVYAVRAGRSDARAGG